MSRNNIEDIYPLSPLQEGLLFHTLYTPDEGAYFQHLLFGIHGRLDVECWQQAWRQVVARHSILRTAFAWERLEKPLQIVLRRAEIPWQVFDWRGLDPQEQQEQLQAFLESDRRRGLNPAQAPLLRMTLIRLCDERYEFICSQHHLLVDGWSTPVIIRELLALYRAEAGSTAAVLDTALPFKNYILWLQRQNAAQAEQFWRRNLEGFGEPTPLPGLQHAAGKFTHNGGRVEGKQQLSLSPLGGDRLQTAARKHGVTTGTFVMGAWALLLARYSGREDVVFGVTVSGRPASLPGVNGMVGAFINTLPLRLKLPPGERVVDWLRDVQLRMLELREYEYSSLAQIQKWSDLPPGIPLFETLAAFENYPVSLSREEQRLDEQLEVRDIRLAESVHYPLAAMAVPGQRLQLHISYDARRFSGEAVKNLLEHFGALLEEMTANPERRLSQLSMLTEAERRQLLVARNDTHCAAVPQERLHELFQRRAEAAPEAVALCLGRRQLTYGELNRRANQLAHYLRKFGVGPETCVGVCVERSFEMVIGLLGVLKAGGAYIPLEPSLPRERIRSMLEDGRVKVLLTQEHLASGLLEHDATMVSLDSDWESIAGESWRNPESGVSPDDPAYVIYTSGSTGRPKGVMISHRAVCNTLLWRRETFALGPDDCFLQSFSFSFDASVWQIFSSLISGGRLVLLPPESRGDVGRMLKLMIEHGVTVADFSPSLLQTFLQEEGVEECRSLRQICCGGEAMTVELAEACRRRLNAQLLNLYGPTEMSIITHWWPVPRIGELETVPIGRPLANARAYVLDQLLRPMPVGAAGQLYLGGVGVARGYLGRPALTAERFLPDPFSTEPGARLYSTGDLARLLPDGDLEFLGRVDGQVKIRGYRIEPGEIESVLRQHGGVCEAAVVARPDAQGDSRLVAYVVARGEAANSFDELRDFLRRTLPDYMIPADFVRLEKMPLTLGGKIDRGALPTPEVAGTDTEAAFAPPRGPVEEMLAGMWAHVLGRAQPNAHDNFFALGGHSLKATRLLSRIREGFRVQLPLRTLFDRPTVAQQAEAVEALMKEGDAKTLPPIEPSPRAGDPPMSYEQQRLWFFDRMFPDSAVYNIVGAYRIGGLLDVDALEHSLNEVVARHEILRTVFAESESQFVQVIAPFERLTVTLKDLGHVPEAEREAEALRLAGEEARRRFDVSTGPLLRVMLLRLREDDHLLLVTMHHIISDGWSFGLFLEELGILYNSRLTRSAPSLPELPIQYADFAHWQQCWLRDEALAAELAYWKRQLSAAPALLELPIDRPRPAVQRYRGATLDFVLPGPPAAKLKQLSRSESVTLFMTLLTVFKLLLGRYSGQADIVVGSVTANRNRSEIERVLGFFVNTVVLRTDISGDPTFRQLLSRVREVTLGAYTHEAVPFEMLVEELHPERSLSHHPLFQVMFTFQNLPSHRLGLLGLEVRPQEVSEEAAKFDLTLAVAESGEVLAGEIEYNTDLFDRETIARMAGHFRNLLVECVEHPDSPVSRLALMSADEQHQLLTCWNDTARDFPLHRCVHELFESQAERTPDAAAVIHDTKTLSYAELNARANQLAQRLRRSGVGLETRVGICMKPSTEMVVAFIAVLKAGGAYLPLDPRQPRERLSRMLEDAEAALLISERRLAHLFEHETRKVIFLDEECDDESRDNLPPTASAINAAYVVYTSGSTGRPKGVVVTHEALVNHNLAVVNCYELGARARVLQAASPGFDVAAEELFPTLLSGACLIIPSAPIVNSVTEFSRFVADERITLVNLPTPFWHEWTAALADARCSLPESLRLVVIGSDKASPSRYRMWQNAVGGRVRLLNAYGLTEVTITSTVYDGGHESRVGETVPIGRPLANTRAYILDSLMRPVPRGVAGELYLGGPGLARGYLGAPALTAERFIPDPLSGAQGARLYRTGDTARLLPDGNLMLTGRADEQVKVRGYRVEPGEVEAALSTHPGVRQAVVVAHEDQTVGSRLIAYVVEEAGAALSEADLKNHLGERLPAYMLPAAYVRLPELPLTRNGKIDRGALPVPARSRAEDARQPKVVHDFLEVPLLRIWEDVLGVKPVSPTDNFFDLGGHSILALRLMGAIHRRFGREMPLSILFERPTVEQLAQALREEFEDGDCSPLTPIQPKGDRSPIFFVHVGSGHVLCYLDLARRLGTDQPFYGLQDPHLYTREFPDIPVEEMAARYIESVREVQPRGPYRLGGWSFGGTVAFEMARQFKQQGEEVEWLALLDTGSPELIRRRGDLDNNAALLGILAREMDLPMADSELEPLTLEEMLSYTAEKMKRAQLLLADPAVFIKRQLDVMKSRTRVIYDYHPGVYPGHITFFRAESEDEGGTLTPAVPDDPTLGFAALSTEPVEVYTVPGNHHQIAREPHVRALAEAMLDSLGKPAATCA